MNFRVSNLTRADSVALLIAATIFTYFTLFFLYSVFANYWPGPFVDYWIDIPNVEKFFNGELTFHDLISAHANVHRLFIPRLLFIADYRFFAGSNVLLVWISIICKVSTLLLFNYIIRDQSFRSKLLLNTLLFAAIFNAANLSNVLHNSNMQWDLASVFACLAIYFYSRDVYSQNLSAPSPPMQRIRSIAWAWLFFAGGFLSQAGALPVIFVFVCISLLNKRWLESAFSLLMVLLVLYLTFALLPVNEPEKATYENAVAMMLFKLKYVAIYIFKMFSGSVYPLDNRLFVFSWLLLAMFVVSLVFAGKTRPVYNNVFLAFAVFAFLMMVTIAAARVDFSPNTWSANRYQTNVLLFILALSLHCYFSVSVFFSRHTKILQNAVFIFSLGSFFITQYFLHNYAVIFGNKVFDAQSYMLTHGATQYNGASLLPSLQEHDRIAASDPLFRQHGFAWYANKQAGHGFYRQSKNSGELFLRAEEKIPYFGHNTINNGNITYHAVEGGLGFAFATPLDTEHQSFLATVIARNTYYVLDIDGIVIGFAYVFINPDHLFSQAEIRGYVTATTAHSIAKVSSSGQPVCLFVLAPNKHKIHDE